MTIEIAPIVAGSARGQAIVLDEPLSLWGGFDAATGVIVEAHHPQYGTSLTDAIVFLPSGRGSSSSSSILVEAVRLGTAPAALVLGEADDVLVLGSLVAQELYAHTVPIAVWSGDHRAVQGHELVLAGARLSTVPTSGSPGTPPDPTASE